MTVYSILGKVTEMTNFAAVIPALNPQKQLLDYVQQLYKLGIQFIVVVNDGSEAKYDSIFEGLAMKSYCHILKNERNEGKGYSLKKGFRHILNTCPSCDGVITIGAHGQHRLQDVQLMLKMTKVFSHSIILGVRNMKSPDVTFSQYIGNRATTMLFNLLYHKCLLDTQSGLRYIPTDELPWLVEIKGSGFDYDTNMLVQAIKRHYPIYEIQIGNARLKKNTLLHYDEVMTAQEVMKQMLTEFFGEKGKRKKKHIRDSR